MSSGGGSAPAPRNLYQETAGELKAKSDLAPNVFGAEAQFDPQYANLNLSNLSDTLLGTPATTREMPTTQTVHGFRNSLTGAFSTSDPTAGMSAMLGSDPALANWEGGANGVSARMGQWLPFDQQNTVQQQFNVPANPGLLDLEGKVQGITDQQAAQSQARQASGNIANLNQYGGAGVSALMNADPQTAMLMQQLTDQASQGVAAGSSLSPAQMRLVSQNVRQGQADRGMGFGPADQYGEALGVSQFGQSLLQSRLQNATNVAGQRYAMYGGPNVNMITGVPQNYGGNAVQQGYGISSNVGPKLFGSDINANDIADSNFNAANARSISSANNSAAMTSAGISGGLGLGAATMVGLGMAGVL